IIDFSCLCIIPKDSCVVRVFFPEIGLSLLFTVCELHLLNKLTVQKKYQGIDNYLFRLSERTSNYFVRAGSNKPYEGGSLHRVIKIHVYDNAKYSYLLSGVFYHDVALFQVKPRFRFSNTVQAIRLPHQFNRSPRKLYVCGWGYTSLQNNAIFGNFFQPRISDVLMGVFVSRTPHEICINETPEYEAIINKEYHLCYGTRGKDSCYGDSGGPLASRNILYGVVSFGQDCAVVSGVYENVSYYRNWIKEITNL
uniref:trypsin alpha-3-like n=1 Tax=Osmia lignaria TaxID=473952 RepID=UPI0014780BB7